MFTIKHVAQNAPYLVRSAELSSLSNLSGGVGDHAGFPQDISTVFFSHEQSPTKIRFIWSANAFFGEAGYSNPRYYIGRLAYFNNIVLL